MVKATRSAESRIYGSRNFTNAVVDTSALERNRALRLPSYRHRGLCRELLRGIPVQRLGARSPGREFAPVQIAGTVDHLAEPASARPAFAVGPAIAPDAPCPAVRQRNIASRAAPARIAQWRVWCSYCPSSGIRIATASCMHSPQCPFKLLRHPGKRQIKRRAPSNQHIFMTCAQPICSREPNDFRRRRRTRLRSTALPTFFDTAKPNRAGLGRGDCACSIERRGRGP